MAVRETVWPKLRKLRLTGGPAGVNVLAQLDGEKVQKCSRVVIDAGVGDAVRIITYQFAEVDVEIEGIQVDGGFAYEADVKLYDPQDLGEPRIRINHTRLHVKADTPWEALRDAARQLELEATTGVAPGGTIPEPSGRPPGH